MIETVLNRSLLAPAIGSVSQNGRRRVRAAERRSRRLSSTAGDEFWGGDMVLEMRPRPPFEQIALVLQGAVRSAPIRLESMRRWAAANIHPDWIAGVSIGAINGALIAGNVPEARVAKLRVFWERVTTKPYCDWSERGSHAAPSGSA
jgi:predicted acylesterase/phospholipase RssA